MYIVVAGGGHMGTHLVGRLVSEGHDTVIVDVDAAVTERIFAEQGVVAVTGNATDLTVLEQAGIKRADVAVAMTGRDSDNLSFCLLARYFGVPRVLARMLDPKYEVPYRLVGATRVHSEAEILVNSFLTSITFPEVSALMPVGGGDIVAFELRVPVGSPMGGRTVAEVARLPGFPRRCVFIGVESAEGELEVPSGETVIAPGAGLIMAAHRPDLPHLLGLLAPARRELSPAQAEAMETLRFVPFLAGMSPDDLAELAVGARTEERRHGETVFRIGEPGDRLYIVKKGAVELESRGGLRRVVRPPSHFGETSAVTGQPRTQTARAVEDSSLLALDSAALRGVLVRNPFLALELAKALSESP